MGVSARCPVGSMVWKWETVICYDDQNKELERFTQSFNESGHVLSQLIEEKSGDEWVNNSRILYTNDLNGKVLTARTDLWQSGNWQSNNRITISYDASGRIIMEEIERFQGGLWASYVRRSYGYDGNGRKSSMIQDRWIGAMWESDLRTTYTYNANINIVIMEYSDEGGPWQVGGRFTYTCDLNGNYDALLIESWEENQWLNGAKVDYTNDAQGNILSEWAYAPDGNNWVNDSRKTYTYDIHGNVITGINEEWDAGTWLPAMQTSYLYSKKEYMLLLNVPVYRYEAVYKGFPLGVDDELDASFRLYPNPATDIVTIDAEKLNNDIPVLYIRNNLGELINVLKLDQDQSRIDVSGFSSGLYLFNIQTRDGSATRKVIVH